MEFSQVSQLLDQIEKISSKQCGIRQKTEQLRRELARFWNYHHSCLSNPILLFSFLRLLIPDQDRPRKYGLRETLLIRELVQILGIQNTLREVRLKQWKFANSGEKYTGQGNLGSIVGDVVKMAQPAKTSKMDIQQVNRLLDELASFSEYTTQENGHRPIASTRKRLHVLLDLYTVTLAVFSYSEPARSGSEMVDKDYSQKHASNIVFVEESALCSASMCKHPLSHASIFKFLYFRQMDLNHVSSKIVQMIEAGHTRDSIFNIASDTLNHSKLKEALRSHGRPLVGVYLSSMESQRPSSVAQVLTELAKASNPEKNACAEIKYDGERMQIHVKRNAPREDQIRIFSKSGRNSTMDRSHTHSIIRDALELDLSDVQSNRNSCGYQMSGDYPSELLFVRECIIEGELVIYDETLQKIEPFGRVREFRTVGSTDTSLENVQKGTRHPMIVFFEVLYLNGETILREPYFNRRKTLEAMIKIRKSWAELSVMKRFPIPSLITLASCAPLSDYFCTMIKDAQEGLMIKGEKSIYEPGKRVNWHKLKLGYMGLGETAEYAVLGGSYENNQNNFLKINMEENPTLLNVFHVGCLMNKDEVEKQGFTGIFRLMFSFTAGFSREELICFSNFVEGDRVRARTNHEPDEPINFEIDRRSCQLDAKIDFFFRNPVVVELTGQEFVQDSWTQFWTLRHPVFDRLCRLDKNLMDTISFQELQELGSASKFADNQTADRFLSIKDRINHINLEYFAPRKKKKQRECKVSLRKSCASKTENLQDTESLKRKRAYLEETQENCEEDLASVISAYSASTIDPNESRPSEDIFSMAFFSRSWIHLHHSILQSDYLAQVSALMTQTGLDQCLIHSLHALITSCSSDPTKESVPIIILVDNSIENQENFKAEIASCKSQILDQENRVSRAQMILFDWRVLHYFLETQGKVSLERIQSFFIGEIR